MRADKRGSTVIEVCITFSLVIVLIVIVINEAVLFRTDIMMQGAVEQTCEDFSIFLPLSIPTSDVVSTLANAAPDEINEQAERVMATVMTYAGGFDIASGNSLTAAILDISMSQSLSNDIASGYIQRNGSDLFLPERIDVDFDIDAVSGVIYVIVQYEVNTIRGPVARRIVDTIPFWGDMELFLNGEAAEDEQSDVWALSNINRGTWFEKHYGANLPHTFPVINSWDGSTATSIISVNTCARTYQNRAVLSARVMTSVERLAQFEGADVVIGGTNYAVKADEICERELIVVIPRNSPEESVMTVEALQAEAAVRGVRIVIEQYGNA